MLGLGLGLWTSVAALASGGGGGGWTPSSPATPLAMWHTVSAATCFTDTAGTVAVTADLDAVACVRSSADGSILFTQSTSGSRPKYRTGGGKPYLEFDGVDDYLVTPAVVTLTDGSGQHSTFASVYFANNTGNQSILFAAYTNGIMALNNNTGASQSVVYNSGGSSQSDTGPAITSAAGTVVSEISDTTTTEAFVNGSGNGSSARSGTPYAGTDDLTLGSVNGVSQQMTGRIYGFAIWKGVLSAPDRASALTYFSGLY